VKHNLIATAAFFALGAVAWVGTASAQSTAPATTTSRLATGYTLINLGTLGGKTSVAYAINTSGQVVGSSEVAGGGNHAFLFSDGPLVDLGTLGGGQSIAYAINDAGQVVGEADINAPKNNASRRSPGPPPLPTSHPFLYQEGKMKDLRFAATRARTSTYATGINKAGQVVGESNSKDFFGFVALLYSDGKTQDLGSLVSSQVR